MLREIYEHSIGIALFMNSPAFDPGNLPDPYSVKNPGSIK